ncbi:cupin domain-containing protein [Lusitaniella coriacea LEGE 07157]|uniref:Cupin domain-containing protein n=1 Tax=Lusitaniella coriacea LEGE 07157 TaxID=945747 RepID=A0A8J7ALZ0_9CYAN|nr:cupin domain-containing protein [Lusitaniella coriacea]MBE9114303.1 cupin domain-containing protein [Lusitaniella coriacea LEGE 07157]
MNAIEWSNGQDSPVQTIFRGISARQLWQGKNDAQAVIVQIEPGARWEGIDFHRDNSEEVLVLAGVFNDGTRNYPAGTFIHHPIGSSHIPQSKTGCTLFVFYPEKTIR